MDSRREKKSRGSEEEMHNTLAVLNITLQNNAHQINSHTVMLLNLLSGLLAAVTPTVTG